MTDEQRPKVLLVDDDDTLASLMKDKFDAEGIELMRAASGEDALRMLLEGALPAVILLDLELSTGMDGFEVMKKIHADEQWSKIPVVMLSNYSREEDIEWGKKLGVKKFVEKVSVVPDDIAGIVKEFFSQPAA